MNNYEVSQNQAMGASPVWWIMEDGERVAGVHWGLHKGESDKAKLFAEKIANALNKCECAK